MNDDDDVAEELRRLRSEVDSLRRRIESLEAAVDENRSGAPGESPARSSEGESRPAGGRQSAPADDPRREAPPRRAADERSTGPATAPPESGAVDDPDEERDLERDLGIKVLGLVGGLALVVGVVFFVRLAIEAGLLGPLGRVLLGSFGGLGLFAAGRVAAERQGYVRWGRIAAGVGLAIAYFSTYAAYGFETYRAALGTPLWAVLLALTALIAGIAAASIRDGAPIVAGEAFALGYVTAFLALDAGTFAVTPAYAVLLTMGLVVVATVRPWSPVVATSVLSTYGVLLAWNIDLDPAPEIVAGALVVAFGTYLVGGYVLRASDREDRLHGLAVGALTLLNAGIAALYLEATVRDWLPDAPIEGLAVGVVGLVLVGVYAWTRQQPVRRDDVAGAFAVVLLATGVVLAAGPFAATVGLLAIVLGGVAVADRFDATAVGVGAHLVAAGTAYKLLAVDATDLPAFDAAEPLATATGRPVAFALAVAVAYGLAWWYRTATWRLPRIDRAIPVAAPYVSAGTGFAVVLLGLELSGAAVSVAWAAFGLVLVGAGMRVDVRTLRFQGIAVLGLATVKAFLYDTRGLDPIARTLSFLLLGAILLVASYAYARWQGEDPLDRLTGG